MKRLAAALLLSLAMPAAAQAQSACARAVMMAGPDVSGPAEVRQKRMLERECEIERAEDRNRQALAQKRIEARSSWAAVRPQIKACIDAKLEPDGRNIEQLIGLGIAASDDAIAAYRRECFGLPPEAAESGFRAPAAAPAAPVEAQSREAAREAGREAGPARRDAQRDLLRGNEEADMNSSARMNAAPGTIILNGGGGGGGPVVILPGGPMRSINLLEAAANPLTGSRRLWESFKDEGGLATYTDFHGVKISKVAVDVREDRVRAARMEVPAATPPRKLREALSTACQGEERNWRLATDHRGTRGELQTPTLTCRYETDDGASDYAVSIVSRQ